MNLTLNAHKPTQTPSLFPFFIIWTGQAFSLLGSSLVRFSLIWYMTQSTGSATTLAIATLVSLAPTLLFGPIAGTLVDRWNRRIVLIAADGFIALATAVLAVLFALDAAQVWHIYAIMSIRALGGTFHAPAMLASTTLMAPEKQYTRIAGLNNAFGSAVSIIAPPLGALLIGFLPLQNILAIDVGTALLAIGPLLFIAIPQPERKEPSSTPSVLEDLREGLRFVRDWRGFTMLIAIIMFVNLVFSPAASLTPLLVVNRFKGGALELAWMQTAMSLGLLLGGLILGIWGGGKRRIVPSMAALTFLGVSMAALGLVPEGGFLLAAGVMFCVGFTIAFGAGLRVAMIQAVVPPEMQGRVFTLLWSGGAAMAPLGLAVAGPAADVWGVQFWFVVCGILTAVLGAATFFVPAIMQIEEGHHSQ